WFNGAVNGWDRWVNQHFRWGYAGGLVWDSPDERTNLTFTFNAGPNQFPWFFKTSAAAVVPNGVVSPPFLAGRRNVLYNQDNAFLLTGTLIHEATDSLTAVVEFDYGFEPNVPGFGPAGTPANAEWSGLGWFLLYEFSDRLTGVYRGDFFRDRNGVRT